jgi:hypothetical protein
MWQKSIVLAIVALALPTALYSQQWSDAQLEVWDFQESCWQKRATGDVEGFLTTCFHKDYVGWFSPEPAPMPVNESVVRYFMESSPIRVYLLKPHDILISGNVAIVHYSAFTVRPGPDGKDQEVWVHWTDVAVKEDGRWSWIADHGHGQPATN